MNIYIGFIVVLRCCVSNKVIGWKMKSKIIVSAMAVSMVLFSVAPAKENARPLSPQCGQYCVYHVCQLLGVPLTLDQILKCFPPKNQGDSLLDISDALQSFGIECRGKRYSLNELTKSSFPLVVHFHSNIRRNDKIAGHFVVVESASSSSVKLYFGNGTRGSMLPEDFVRLWSGYVLSLNKQEVKSEFINSGNITQPRIQFETLFRDAGDIPSEEKEIVFSFPFKNRGEKELIIENIATSCNCMTIEDDYKKILSPGQESCINVVYNLKKRGRFEDSIFIKTNDPVHPNVSFSICGNVLPEKIVYSPVDFGSVVKGKKTSVQHDIYYDSELPAAFLLSKSEQNCLDVTIHPLSEADIQNALPKAKLITVPNCFNRFVLNVAVDTNILDVGKHRMMIKLVNANNKKYEVIVPVHIKVEEG